MEGLQQQQQQQPPQDLYQQLPKNNSSTHLQLQQEQPPANSDPPQATTPTVAPQNNFTESKGQHSVGGQTLDSQPVQVSIVPHNESELHGEEGDTSDDGLGKDSEDKRKEKEGVVEERKGGRRKINIEFIENKSRRHVTFSKRKAGLIKKAYELSTLTGTQVLLLVASETGNVYTFATPKLQPLITKPEGKTLIQACLNPPEEPAPPATSNPTTPGSSAAGQTRRFSTDPTHISMEKKTLSAVQTPKDTSTHPMWPPGTADRHMKDLNKPEMGGFPSYPSPSNSMLSSSPMSMYPQAFYGMPPLNGNYLHHRFPYGYGQYPSAQSQGSQYPSPAAAAYYYANQHTPSSATTPHPYPSASANTLE